jgi:hypothetical protein
MTLPKIKKMNINSAMEKEKENRDLEFAKAPGSMNKT